jgi:hypothetical protein
MMSLPASAIITVIEAKDLQGKADYLNLSTPWNWDQLATAQLSYLGRCEEALSIIAQVLENSPNIRALDPAQDLLQINAVTGAISIRVRSEKAYSSIIVEAASKDSHFASCDVADWPWSY